MAKKKAPKQKEEPTGSAAAASSSAASSSSSPPLPRVPRAKRRCCPDWLGWVASFMFIFGVGPVALLYLPELLPPVEEADGRFTMVGGGSFEAVRGLYSLVNIFGTPFCAEHGARDTVKCHFSVLQLAVGMLTAPDFVDFYTVVPQAALSDDRIKQFGEGYSPLRIDANWAEAFVDGTGVAAAQVAAVYADLSGTSGTRLAPATTRFGPLVDTPVCAPHKAALQQHACAAEFSAVFGKDRKPVVGHDSCEAANPGVHEGLRNRLWSSGRTTFYVFGLEAAIALTRSIPSSLPKEIPYNIVIFPLADPTSLWHLRTRGRHPCDKQYFRESYENSFHYISWALRTPGKSIPKLPGK